MKDNKHIQSFNEHQEKLNISDVSDSSNYNDLQVGMKVKDGMGDIYTITFVDYKLGVELTPRFRGPASYFPQDFNNNEGDFWGYFTLIN